MYTVNIFLLRPGEGCTLLWASVGEGFDVPMGLMHWVFTGLCPFQSKFTQELICYLHTQPGMYKPVAYTFTQASLSPHTFLQGILTRTHSPNFSQTLEAIWTLYMTHITYNFSLSVTSASPTLPSTPIRSVVIALDCVVIQSHWPLSVHHRLCLQVSIVGMG